MSTTTAIPERRAAAREAVPALPRRAHAPLLPSLTLALFDLLALALALGAGYLVRHWADPGIAWPHPVLLLVPVCTVAQFGFSGHYPGLGLTAVEHIRRMWRGISFVYLLLAAAIFLSQNVSADSRGAVVLAWLFSLGAAPTARWLATGLLESRRRWGVPVIVVGAGETGRAVIRNLRLNRVLGYRPVACVDDDPDKRGCCEGVPVMGPLADAELVAARLGARHAIVAIPGMDRGQLVWHLRRWRQHFPRILIVPNLAGIASLWTQPRDLGGFLGLEIRHNLLNPWNQRIKRAMDIAGSALGLAVAAPVLGLCVCWIKRASPGSAFYTQEREGQDGQTIRVFKLRTMHVGAERMLREYLAANPAARAEWDRFCKLKRDPRILPGVGQLLRKTSLDELPQLWNVLKGEMSLVGPRPFPEYHNARFGAEFRWVRTRVKPGLTGLWQVSARSNGDLGVQESLDSYYIRNWSPWLDLYILARTVRTVAAREGAC